jgi:hypothetical protein
MALPDVYGSAMCRNIRTLHNFEPPATDDEIRAAALQYVRKVSGQTTPSKANEAVFARAVDEIAHVTHHLLADLVTAVPPKDRDAEAAKAKARAAKRFGGAAHPAGASIADGTIGRRAWSRSTPA